jgi:hypothetical protein
MIYFRVIVLAIGLLATTSAISAEFDWSQYKSITIQELIRSADESTKDTGANFEMRRGFYAGVMRYKAVVQFTGKFRDIPEQHAEFMERLPKIYNFIPSETIHLYSKELLLQEGALQIWCPIQEVLIKPLQEELRVGDTFEVYFCYFGAVYADHILGINEFQKTSEPGRDVQKGSGKEDPVGWIKRSLGRSGSTTLKK